MRFIVKQRFLTSGERALAKAVFADSLKLDGIKIIAHRLILKGYAMSPDGHVYFNPKDWVEDFSILSVELQSWLIHELTHVWQIQQGIKVVRKALVDRRYRYILEEGKDFLQYGVEQQAQMVQDYFLRKQRKQACDDIGRCIPFVKEVV